ncbi:MULTISPECIES: NAD(P)-dependent oxidoreductase [unclassified Legionella]|uniref:NAD-dependent epimerase/dehydratase family protein n=1 Tax=unclassified Legionella TaxID=2622702 RepID=UPI001056CAA3|nr:MULTISPECIES: NAD-dependent epimerase/dehydratase family protein [unclassified Legionella]MDI9819354.1 NAD-dependent epimerase/dehydratase family protein [Legionella sp. PL877]
MRILVTGAAGFIGSHLVQYHLKKGDTVCGIDDMSSGVESNIQPFLPDPEFHFIQDDIITWPEIEKFAAWADRIYHMAAIVGVYKVIDEPERVLAVNIAGCERLLRAVRKANWKAQLLLASSAEVYGPSNKLPLAEDDNIILETAAKNRWNYAISKLANEAMGLSYHQKFNIPIVMARLFNTIGPRQTGRYGMVVPNFVKQAMSNLPITVFGTGNQTRSFCDVRDTVVMLDLLMNTNSSFGEIINVGNDREITINQLANVVKQTVNPDAVIDHIPYLEAYGENYVDIQRRRPQLKKLFSLIEFQHQWSLEATIKSLMNL